MFRYNIVGRLIEAREYSSAGDWIKMVLAVIFFMIVIIGIGILRQKNNSK